MGNDIPNFSQNIEQEQQEECDEEDEEDEEEEYEEEEVEEEYEEINADELDPNHKQIIEEQEVKLKTTMK